MRGNLRLARTRQKRNRRRILSLMMSVDVARSLDFLHPRTLVFSSPFYPRSFLAPSSPPSANMRPSHLAVRGREAAVLLARRLYAVRHRRRPRQFPVRVVVCLRRLDRWGEGGLRARAQACCHVRGVVGRRKQWVVALPGTTHGTPALCETLQTYPHVGKLHKKT